MNRMKQSFDSRFENLRQVDDDFAQQLNRFAAAIELDQTLESELRSEVLSWREDIKALQSLEKRMEDFLEHHNKEATQRAGFRLRQDDLRSEMAALSSAQQQQKHELLLLKPQVLNLQQLDLLEDEFQELRKSQEDFTETNEMLESAPQLLTSS